MAGNPYTQPPFRQVLVNIGNRFVVFGTQQSLPMPIKFDPENAHRPTRRVGDETEIDELHIIESIRVSDARLVARELPHARADFALLDDREVTTIVEFKVQDRAPRLREIEAIFKAVRAAQNNQATQFEVWYLNVERLQLQIFWRDAAIAANQIELTALDVWDYGNEGDKVFRRTHVVERVDDWARRIDTLYEKITEWAAKQGLRTERKRTVTMAEELMERFAVPDRELPVLDVLSGEEPVASFVPRGLWIIGANGRIDIITSSGFRFLTDQGRNGAPNWVVIDSQDRRKAKELNEHSFQSILDQP
jgi:hypothetical protein